MKFHYWKILVWLFFESGRSPDEGWGTPSKSAPATGVPIYWVSAVIFGPRHNTEDRSDTDTRITPHSGIAICKFNTLSQDETSTCFPSIKLKNSLSVLLNLSAMKLRTALRWIFHPLWRKHQTVRRASTSSEQCFVLKLRIELRQWLGRRNAARWVP